MDSSVEGNIENFIREINIRANDMNLPLERTVAEVDFLVRNLLRKLRECVVYCGKDCDCIFSENPEDANAYHRLTWQMCNLLKDILQNVNWCINLREFIDCVHRMGSKYITTYNSRLQKAIADEVIDGFRHRHDDTDIEIAFFKQNNRCVMNLHKTLEGQIKTISTSITNSYKRQYRMGLISFEDFAMLNINIKLPRITHLKIQKLTEKKTKKQKI